MKLRSLVRAIQLCCLLRDRPNLALRDSNESAGKRCKALSCQKIGENLGESQINSLRKLWVVRLLQIPPSDLDARSSMGSHRFPYFRASKYRCLCDQKFP